jgi:hypothetical protein
MRLSNDPPLHWLVKKSMLMCSITNITIMYAPTLKYKTRVNAVKSPYTKDLLYPSGQDGRPQEMGRKQARGGRKTRKDERKMVFERNALEAKPKKCHLDAGVRQEGARAIRLGH